MGKKLEITSSMLRMYQKACISYRQIAKIYNCSESTIRNYFLKYNLKKLKKQPGRKKLVSKRATNLLRHKYLDCTLMSAQDGVNLLESASKIQVSRQTVRRLLNQANLTCLVRQKKTEITKSQLTKRKIFWQTYHNYSFHDYKNFIFSDESTFQVRSTSGQKTFYGKKGSLSPVKSHIKTVKFGGGSIMVWGYITIHGVGKLHRIDGTIKSKDYCNILNSTLLDTMLFNNLNISDFYFVQDNAPCHTSKETLKWLGEQNIKLITWPPNSPDMNIIENVWRELKRAVQLRDQEIFNKDSLWIVLQDEFKKISLSYITNLYKSMPRRLSCLKKNNYNPTKY